MTSAAPPSTDHELVLGDLKVSLRTHILRGGMRDGVSGSSPKGRLRELPLPRTQLLLASLLRCQLFSIATEGEVLRYAAEPWLEDGSRLYVSRAGLLQKVGDMSPNV